MRVFNVDFTKLAVLLLPIALRKPILVAYLRCMMLALANLHTRFMQSRSNRIYDITHNAQVCYLRAALNDQFFPRNSDGQRDDTFIIEDQAIAGVWRIAYDETPHLASRQLIVSDEPTSLTAYDESTITLSQGTFIVRCPSTIYNNPDSMALVRAITNKYRLVSRLPTYRTK